MYNDVWGCAEILPTILSICGYNLFCFSFRFDLLHSWTMIHVKHLALSHDQPPHHIIVIGNSQVKDKINNQIEGFGSKWKGGCQGA